MADELTADRQPDWGQDERFGADAASRALQACVQPTFRDLQMKYLPRKWLEIIAVKP